jgi:hypothetical protein
VWSDDRRAPTITTGLTGVQRSCWQSQADSKGANHRPLRDLGDDLHAISNGVRPAEAPDRLALHLGRIVQRAIAGVDDADRVAVGVALAQKLIEQIDQTISGSQAGSEAPIEPGTVLRAILGRTPDGRVETMPEPLIPLLDTTLLTNAPGEPRVGNQLLTELHSADRIDLRAGDLLETRFRTADGSHMASRALTARGSVCPVHGGYRLKMPSRLQYVSKTPAMRSVQVWVIQ